MGILRDTMIYELRLRGYSERTIRSYPWYVSQLALYYNKKPIQLSKQEVKDFFIHLVAMNIKVSNLVLYYYAIKFFFTINNMEEKIQNVPLPKRGYHVPVVMSVSEVKSVLNSCSNLRYKAIFSLLYSSGLRLGELCNLKVFDIDFDRNQVYVRSSKGKKDRYTILGEFTRILLHQYIDYYQPTNWLFYSLNNEFRKINTRYIQEKFHILLRQNGIYKKASVHTLRHSFATHLLEQNVNIFYIMKLLGHASISSTLIYLHTQRLDLLNIKSPIDVIRNELEFTSLKDPVQIPLRLVS
jgi:integrase/recombinase XerD